MSSYVYASASPYPVAADGGGGGGGGWNPPAITGLETTATLNGDAAIVDGKLVLDGADDYGSIAHNSSQQKQPGTDWCYSVMFIADVVTGSQTLIGQHNGAGGSYEGMAIQLNGTNIQYYTNNSGAPAGATYTFNCTLEAGKRYHLCVEIDNAAVTCTVWINNLKIGTKTINQFPENVVEPLLLGGQYDGTNYYNDFDGKQWNHEIFQRKITDTERRERTADAVLDDLI